LLHEKDNDKERWKRKLQPPVAIFNAGDMGEKFQLPVGEINILKHLPKALQGQLPTPNQIAALLEKV
jgi:hypothetical protein